MRRVLKFESLRGVDVADGDGEGIGRIGRLGDLGEAEEAGNHEMDLFKTGRYRIDTFKNFSVLVPY